MGFPPFQTSLGRFRFYLERAARTADHRPHLAGRAAPRMERHRGSGGRSGASCPPFGGDTMRTLLAVAAALGAATLPTPALAQGKEQGSTPPPAPLALHPDNPHYFCFRGKPAVLITSAEHYGAVLNLDFDYLKYLDALAADGLNLTRTFSGPYVEPPGAFGIAENTLAPKERRFVCP